jgi:hypothetical protein
MPASDRARAARSLFLALLALFLLATGGRVYSPDGVVMARVAESMARGELAIADPGYPAGFVYPGKDGRSHGKFGLGLPAIAVPFHLLGRALEVSAPASSREVFRGPRFLWYSTEAPEAWRFFGVSLTNSPVVAATGAVLFLLALELGYRRATALAVTLTASLASPLFPYAKSFFSEPLAGLGLTAFALYAARWGGEGRPRDAFLAGSGLALTALAKVAHALLLLPALLAVAWLATGRARAVSGARRRTLGTGLVALGAPLAGAFALLGAANLARFGSLIETGYGSEIALFTTPFLEGARGLLLSPGRGLLPYFPLVLIGLASAPASWRRSPVWSGFTWACLATLVMLYARWHGWDGGWCWGPRFLVPVLPLLALSAAPFFERALAPVNDSSSQALTASARWAGWSVVALSALVSFTGTLVPFTEYHHALRQTFGGQYLQLARWSWEVFPPLAYWRLPKDYWLLPQALQTPSAWWLAAGFGALAGALPLLGATAVRRALGRPEPTAPPRRLGVAMTLGGALAFAAASFLSYRTGTVSTWPGRMVSVRRPLARRRLATVTPLERAITQRFSPGRTR